MYTRSTSIIYRIVDGIFLFFFLSKWAACARFISLASVAQIYQHVALLCFFETLNFFRIFLSLCAICFIVRYSRVERTISVRSLMPCLLEKYTRGGGYGRKTKHFNANDRCFGRELKTGTPRTREIANHLFVMSNLRSFHLSRCYFPLCSTTQVR